MSDAAFTVVGEISAPDPCVYEQIVRLDNLMQFDRQAEHSANLYPPRPTMSDTTITGIYVNAYGRNPKFVVKKKVGPFHDSYDVYRPWYKIDIVKDLVRILDE